jgi:hypothetical protein
MKEKINLKTIVATLLFAYMIGVVCLMIFNYNTAVKSIELHDTKENIIQLNELSKEAENVKNTACREKIEELIQKYEDTSYQGEISLKDFYLGAVHKGGSILSYYPIIKEACYISEEDNEKYNFPYLFTFALLPDDEIMKEYVFQYELHLKDYFTRDVLDARLAGIEYQIERKNELMIISKLIEMEREKGEL